MLKSFSAIKFDPTLEVVFNLNVDPRHSDQMVRGTVVLPHGVGKTARVAVICQNEKIEEATAAGADMAGGEDIIADIQSGKIAFDRCIATPDMMAKLAPVGRILGPRGLMPNPKLGTVTFDVAEAVRNAKLGQVDFKVDKAGVLHAVFGKLSFEAQAAKENLAALTEAIQRLKPATVKSNYILSAYMSATMMPAVKFKPEQA